MNQPDCLLQVWCGFAMLELVVAIVLISTGILGALRLQQYGAVVERDLRHQLYAAAMIEDIVRKMDAAGNQVADFATGFGAPPAAVNCWHSSCTAAQRSRFHLAHWKCRLGKWRNSGVCRWQLRSRALLPDGDGAIQYSHNGWRISVRWLDSRRQVRTLTYRYVSLQP